MILKRLLHEVDEAVCRPTVNGHRVIRYFHRQFHKFFKQFRTKEQYLLATKYFDGSLAEQFPERRISKKERFDSLSVSELPFLLLKTFPYDESVLETLKAKLMDITTIQYRIRYGQLQEYLDDCEATLNLRQSVKRMTYLHGLDRLQLVVNYLQKKKNFLEVRSLVCVYSCGHKFDTFMQITEPKLCLSNTQIVVCFNPVTYRVTMTKNRLFANCTALYMDTNVSFTTMTFSM